MHDAIKGLLIKKVNELKKVKQDEAEHKKEYSPIEWSKNTFSHIYPVQARELEKFINDLFMLVGIPSIFVTTQYYRLDMLNEDDYKLVIDYINEMFSFALS